MKFESLWANHLSLNEDKTTVAATFLRLAENILGAPTETKFRKLRLANPKVTAKIAGLNGISTWSVLPPALFVLIMLCCRMQAACFGWKKWGSKRMRK